MLDLEGNSPEERKMMRRAIHSRGRVYRVNRSSQTPTHLLGMLRRMTNSCSSKCAALQGATLSGEETKGTIRRGSMLDLEGNSPEERKMINVGDQFRVLAPRGFDRGRVGLHQREPEFRVVDAEVITGRAALQGATLSGEETKGTIRRGSMLDLEGNSPEE
jgi:hypothetical protein